MPLLVLAITAMLVQQTIATTAKVGLPAMFVLRIGVPAAMDSRIALLVPSLSVESRQNRSNME